MICSGEWAERVGSSFYLSLCLNHQPAAPEMMEQTFTQVESDNRHRRHSVARVTTTLLSLGIQHQVTLMHGKKKGAQQGFANSSII
ncbi:hypothetical protein OUZ56_004533 [Daphnia magna]|uniref:Uncharacterized protein n=1 Tax=Daphnia magna TaxID=35525 RepID=A0ABQ9YQ29_9CRUS|nr:hypothetical protein OUZ56_004533 [Daphnia magna]